MAPSFTIKSNARRAARHAGFDCDTLDFYQDADGFWTWVEKETGGALNGRLIEVRGKLPDGKMRDLLDMLARPEGITAVEAAEAFGWQRHTARARITTDIGKKLDLDLCPVETDGRGRVYRVTGAVRQTQGDLI